MDIVHTLFDVGTGLTICSVLASSQALTLISGHRLLALYGRRAILTLKAPRQTASENVVCLCRLLNILADFSNLFLHTGKQCGP